VYYLFKGLLIDISEYRRLTYICLPEHSVVEDYHCIFPVAKVYPLLQTSVPTQRQIKDL